MRFTIAAPLAIAACVYSAQALNEGTETVTVQTGLENLEPIIPLGDYLSPEEIKAETAKLEQQRAAEAKAQAHLQKAIKEARAIEFAQKHQKSTHMYANEAYAKAAQKYDEKLQKTNAKAYKAGGEFFNANRYEIEDKNRTEQRKNRREAAKKARQAELKANPVQQMKRVPSPARADTRSDEQKAEDAKRRNSKEGLERAAQHKKRMADEHAASVKSRADKAAARAQRKADLIKANAEGKDQAIVNKKRARKERREAEEKSLQDGSWKNSDMYDNVSDLFSGAHVSEEKKSNVMKIALIVGGAVLLTALISVAVTLAVLSRRNKRHMVLVQKEGYSTA